MKTAHRIASRAKRRYVADPMAMFRVLGRVEPFTPAQHHHSQPHKVMPPANAVQRLRNVVTHGAADMSRPHQWSCR